MEKKDWKKDLEKRIYKISFPQLIKFINKLLIKREKDILKILEYVVENEYGEGKEITGRIINNFRNQKLKL